MGLAIILIVVVGVMGAGLLVFVRNDLQAVVQVNQGQQAFEAADAGVQAARRELLSNACPQSYDNEEAGTASDDDPCADSEESEWSYADGFENAQEGKKLRFESSDDTTVKIRHLPFHEDDESCDEGSPSGLEAQQHTNCAPEEKQEDDERHFFRVESEGKSSSGEARRKIEAVLYTYDLGVPKAYYSPSDITIAGNTCISNVSVFSLGKINSTGNSGCDNGGKIEGKDRAYDDWQNDYNATARSSDDAGFAAVQGVEDKLSGRDYDNSTDPRFVVEPSDPQNSDEITFPFDHESQEGEQDEERLSYYREEALKQQEETKDSSHFQTGVGNISDWPENSTDSTVVYVDAAGASAGKVGWNISGGCSDEPVKGTLVVDGATLEVKGNDAFSGVTIVRDGKFDNGGSSCWDGFVSADEGMKLAGTPDPFVSRDVVDRPGFYGVETWSWRELYG